MTTTIDAATPHEAMVSLLQLFDRDREKTTRVTVAIERPANTTIDMTANPASPLEDFVAALTFLGEQRGTIWSMANALAPKVMCGASGGEVFSINGDEIVFCKPLKESALGMSIGVKAQVLMKPVVLNGALRPMSEKLVTYGMLHSIVAEITRNDVGRAFYDIDTLYSGRLPPVMTADTSEYYAPPSPYPHGLRSTPLLDGRHDGLQWLQDVHMLTTERVVVGLRHQWVRRVAVPVVMAHAHLRTGDKKQTALDAVKILRQCNNLILRDACTAWIAKQYGLTAEDLGGRDLA